MSTVETDSTREAQFAIGSFAGVLISGFGIAFYWLAMARGVKANTGGFIPDGLQSPLPILTIAGVVLMLVGLVGRLYRSKFSEDLRDYARVASTSLLILGFGVVSLALGAETNQDAPWLVTSKVPVTLLVGLVGGFVFPYAQLSRLSRGHRLLSKQQKGIVVLASVVLILVAVVPGVVYVGGLIAGNASAGASAILPNVGITLGGGMQKVLMLVIAFEMMFVGYAVLRTAARVVGW